MGEEIGGEEESGWRKAIPEARDRLQSRVLVGVVGTLLVWMSGETIKVALSQTMRFPALPAGGLAVSVAFALLVWSLRAATAGAAVCGGMICLLMTFWTGSFSQSVLRSGLTPLAVLFVLTFLATRAGRSRKAKAGLAEGRKGRSAAQVIANLSVAGLSVVPWSEFAVRRWLEYCCMSGVVDVWAITILKAMCLAALVEATADTVSSEIGQAFGGTPVMVLSLRRVASGTDGAVTLLGSIAGIAAGTLVAAVGMWALRLRPVEAAIALVAGVGGLFFDSLLGATVERRGWIGNDLVNLSSTVFAAGAAVGLLSLLR
jgi:uncharacterized protein (TIGR00297 family)